jgi:hypothetical protein
MGASERGHVASVNQYELREDHKVAITYRYRDGFGEPLQEIRARASVDPDSGNHGWRTWFYRVVPTHSRVLEVAPDYSWALIGYPGREMAWIFARTPDMDKALYKDLAERLRDDVHDFGAVERAGDDLRHGQRGRIDPLHQLRHQRRLARTDLAGDDNEALALTEAIAEIAHRLLVADAFKVELRIGSQLEGASAEAVELLVHEVVYSPQKL